MLLVFLMGLVNKFSNGSIERLNIHKYASVIERTPINKDTTLMVIKVGSEGVVLINNSNHTEVIKTLSESEVNDLEKKRSLSKERGMVLDSPISKLKAMDLSKIGIVSKICDRKKV